MTTPLCGLILEDNPSDADLVHRFTWNDGSWDGSPEPSSRSDGSGEPSHIHQPNFDNALVLRRLRQPLTTAGND
jgi:hypothetical protein